MENVIGILMSLMHPTISLSDWYSQSFRSDVRGGSYQAHKCIALFLLLSAAVLLLRTRDHAHSRNVRHVQ
jgi:hypothetical protein